MPELRATSTYNLDSATIAERFDIGVDVLTVIAETKPEGCIDNDVMTVLDSFEWHMRNVEGVRSVAALTGVVRAVASGFKEGSLKWRTLPRDPRVLAQATAYAPTGSGLLNGDCSVMPVMIYTADHRAETIERVVVAVRAFDAGGRGGAVAFRLAAGNVGVMAAANEEVSAAQFPILGYVFAAVVALCLVSFRSAGGDGVHRHPAGRGLAARLCTHGRAGDRPEDLHPAGSRARRLADRAALLRAAQINEPVHQCDQDRSADHVAGRHRGKVRCEPRPVSPAGRGAACEQADRDRIHVGDAVLEPQRDEGRDRKYDGGDLPGGRAGGEARPDGQADQDIAEQAANERLRGFQPELGARDAGGGRRDVVAADLQDAGQQDGGAVPAAPAALPR